MHVLGRKKENAFKILGGLQNPSAPVGEDQEDNEAGRGSEDDIRRGARALREGRGDLHPRAHAEGVVAHRGQQEEDTAGCFFKA